MRNHRPESASSSRACLKMPERIARKCPILSENFCFRSCLILDPQVASDCKSNPLAISITAIRITASAAECAAEIYKLLSTVLRWCDFNSRDVSVIRNRCYCAFAEQNAEEAVAVYFKKTPRTEGGDKGQCRPKVRGTFAFLQDFKFKSTARFGKCFPNFSSPHSLGTG